MQYCRDRVDDDEKRRLTVEEAMVGERSVIVVSEVGLFDLDVLDIVDLDFPGRPACDFKSIYYSR